MTVTKRVRFEILRRDEHTCQYCGQMAPDVTLHIDHVIPVALGGSDDPGNLVTACRDCNAGKSSISPDSPIVRQVSENAAAYRLGMLDRMTHLRAEVEQRASWAEDFKSIWNGWTYTSTGKPVDLPQSWEDSVCRFFAIGIPRELIVESVRIAMTHGKLQYGEVPEFSYMCGILWKRLEAQEIDHNLTADTAATYTETEFKAVKNGLFVAGWDKGYEYGIEVEQNQRHPGERALVALVDGVYNAA